MKKVIYSIVWLIIVFLVCRNSILNTNDNIVHPAGTNTPFTADRNFDILGENVTLTAAACNYFKYLNPETNKVIEGIKQETVPLGTSRDCSKYYKSEPINTSNSTWEQLGSSAEFVASSESNHQVTLWFSDVSKNWTTGTLIFIWALICAAGLALIYT